MYHHKRQSYKAGDIIYREGELGQHAYILLSGLVRAHRFDSHWDVTVAHFKPDDIFGETSIFNCAPRTVTITAVEDCEVLVLENAQFQNRINDMDPVIRLFIDVVFERFRNAMQGREVTRSLEPAGHDTLEALTHLRLEADIERGIEADEFTLHYQPIVCLRSGKIAGFEALMRWNLGDGKLIPPDVFIPAAEKCGLIPKLTRLAIVRACMDMRELALSALKNPVGCKAPFVAVNISGRDLEEDSFCSFVEQVVQANALAPEALKLEVTESSLMDDIDACCERLVRLKNAGVALAIDDFGTGYSNMGYLAKMPVSTLKIDRSFVMNMMDNPVQKRVTNGMLQFASELGLKVVAEGIETAEQSAYLVEKKCQLGQGYYYSKPVCRQDVLGVIENWKPKFVVGESPLIQQVVSNVA